MESREELRKRLKQKIQDKRNGVKSETPSEQLARTFKQDPQLALLNLGVDEPDVLAHAHNMLRNPHKTLKDLQSAKPPSPPEEDDEEAPP